MHTESDWLQRVASLSESESSQSKFDPDFLEAGCIPPGDLCNYLTIKSGHKAIQWKNSS